MVDSADFSLQGRGDNIKIYIKSSEIQIRTRNPDCSLPYQTRELSYSKWKTTWKVQNKQEEIMLHSIVKPEVFASGYSGYQNFAWAWKATGKDSWSNSASPWLVTCWSWKDILGKYRTCFPGSVFLLASYAPLSETAGMAGTFSQPNISFYRFRIIFYLPNPDHPAVIISPKYFWSLSNCVGFLHCLFVLPFTVFTAFSTIFKPT